MFYFREHVKGVLVEFTSAEWEKLRNLFGRVMKLSELKSTLTELSLQYTSYVLRDIGGILQR
jgi:hypothetical protein